MSVKSNVIIHIQVNLIFLCSIPLYAVCLLYSINSWYLGKVLYETTACWAQTRRGGSNTWLFPWPGFQLVQKKLKCNMALWKGGGEKSVAQLGWSFFFISKLRQREKKHGTVSDPALPWGYEQEPSKTGIECAWERSLEWTSVVSQGAGTRGWQEGRWISELDWRQVYSDSEKELKTVLSVLVNISTFWKWWMET